MKMYRCAYCPKPCFVLVDDFDIAKDEVYTPKCPAEKDFTNWEKVPLSTRESNMISGVMNAL